jgi:hypothetical protein
MFIFVQQINLLQKNNKQQKQFFITNSNTKSIFFEDLCDAFVSANIPLHKLDNHILKLFLENHTGNIILD